MSETSGAGRTGAVLSKLSLIGDLLMLQLAFLVLSFGIVTLYPAAFALQRVLPEAIGQEHPALMRRFWRQFKWAFKRFWVAGLALYFGSIALAFGLFFWASANGPIRIAALAILVPLTGMIVGLYLSALAVLPDAPEDSTSRTVFREANLFLLRRSLAIAGGVIALATWFLLLTRLPTLFVVGSGLVPALLAYWIARTTTTRPKKDSGDVSI
ncbi:hypothetical protein GCM10009789_66080 [Kribbella sancticallisti]|uniref:Membrane protein YesL n=1 Tax=Kribbella sancticallisti TaxID=460087 RepID=A0ABP4QCE5_9ACTN